MTYYQFVHAVELKVKEEAKGQLDVSINAVLKNNGWMRQGIVLKERNINISPTIYLEEYYQGFLRGVELETIAKEILKVYGQVRFETPMDANFIGNYKQIKGKIIYRVINREKNQELLEDVPYKEYLDLAIVYYLLFDSTRYGTASMMISNTHLGIWDVDVEEIHKRAKENTKVLLPYQFKTMSRTMSEMIGQAIEIYEDLLYILTNKTMSYGASAMLYPGCLEAIGEKLEENYYIIPSSVNELIMVREGDAPDEEDLSAMVREVNETQVPDEEVLSDHIYYFDRIDNRLQIVL